MSELENLAGQKQYLEQAIAALDIRINDMHEALKSFSDSVETIKAMNKDGVSDVLCYAGPAIMFRAKVVEPSTVLVSIGSGVVIEKSAEDAVNYCEGKVKEVQSTLDDLLKSRHYNTMHLMALNKQLAEMVGAQS